MDGLRVAFRGYPHKRFTAFCHGKSDTESRPVLSYDYSIAVVQQIRIEGALNWKYVNNDGSYKDIAVKDKAFRTWKVN